jgi:peptidoglycan/xylan/chitin deacetylase (PgdA/CDA1 family)
VSSEPRPAPPPVGPPASGPTTVREVSVTFDDLPVVSVTRGDVASHRAITTRLLAAVRDCGVPAVGFVNEGKLVQGGVADRGRVDLLRQWLASGFELANHTFSHLDLHATPVERYEDDVVRGEPVTRWLLGARGMPLRYFRHPYLRTGTSLPIKRRVEAFLAGRGYTIAPVTVYTEDYLFAAAYDRAELRGDRETARRVSEAYVPYVVSQFEYFEELSRRLLGYEVRQILLLHANSINAERFGAMAAMLEGRGYRFVTLERALEDQAYALPDEYAGEEGISWLQRWALARGLGDEVLDGEPDPPRFVATRSGAGGDGRWLRAWTRVRAGLRAVRGWRRAPEPHHSRR